MRWRSWWVGLAVGCGTTAAICEAPYVNWRRATAPVDQQPLVIRRDAKGDGRFGSPRSGHRRHRGVDLAAPLGSPVRAVRSGTVVQIGWHRGLGRYVELEHRGQLHSLYAHLQEVVVEPGVRVRQGQALGAVRKTGNARHPWITPHPHVEVLHNGTPINPQLLGLHLTDTNPQTEILVATEPGGASDASGGE